MNMKILMISNVSVGLYNFKKEIIEEFLNPGTFLKNNILGSNEVVVCVPNDGKVDSLKSLGCKVINLEVDRRGTNIIKDFDLLRNYISLIRNEKPDIVLTFTIKPNIYAGFACQLTRTKYISSITGLGSSIRGDSKLAPFIRKLYKKAVKKAECIYFENKDDLAYFNNYIYKNNISELIPGSGINLDKFKYIEYPKEENKIKFLTIGRVMKDKGSSELLEAAKIIKENYDNIEFNIVGSYDENSYKETIDNLDKKNIINFLGYRDNISELIGNSHCIIHPSYHEGLSNVLLESAATGRPVIASYIPGCRETFINGKTGIGIKPQDTDSLVKGIEKFIAIDYKHKREMGVLARKYVENKFSRTLVIEKYINKLYELNKQLIQ